MIIKILSSSATFSGVNYNEDKVAKGTAALLAAENFGMLHAGRFGIGDTDYKGHLQSWSKSVDGIQTVKQPQFHAVISCEGREKDAYELQDIAQQFLEKIGYAENPYLVYFHMDTPNNHVHIVSSRVDAEGRKIDDSFERTRSQQAMKEILQQDIGEEMRAHIKKALGYNFSTAAQFKQLLEGQGVKVEDDGIGYCFIKYGRIVSVLDKETVTEKAAKYAAPEERVKQLKALLAKYKPGFEQKELQALLQTKFGVELVFHQAKGKDTPYGYTLIDHAKKQVLKGSQVMKLSELLSSSPQQAEEPLKALRYAQRLEQARRFATSSQEEARAVERVFRLRHDALQVNGGKDEGAREYAADRLNSMLANGRALPDILQSSNWSLVQTGGRHYLVDKREEAIHPVSELTSRRLDYSAVHVLSLDAALSPAAARQVEHSSGTITEMLLLMTEAVQQSGRSAEQERKNKRRLKR